MLDKVFWGNSFENWGIALLIILGTVLIAKLVGLFCKRVILPITRKTRNHVDDIVYDAIESPILFAIMLFGIWIAIHYLETSDKFMSIVDMSYRILVTLNITWFFASFLRGVMELYMAKRLDRTTGAQKHTSRMAPVINRAILAVVWIIGVVMALSNVGVNISALLGTLGIGGIAFALAAQDTIKNIFGAFTIFTDRPFSIGDVIRIDSFEGTVVDIGARSTKMRNYDKRLITIPNSKITDASIINISAEPMRRVITKLGLTYDTTPEKMQEAMNLLRDIPNQVEFVTDKNLAADFTEFGDSALIITFIYFIKKKGGIAETTSRVNMAILNSFNKAGLDFAFPTQTILYTECDKS